MGVEFLAAVGNHTFDKYLLALTQLVLLLPGKFHTLDFSWYEGILYSHGDHLVGEFVYTDERRDILAVTSLKIHDTSHIARFEQVLLVLFGKYMPEIRAVEFRLLSDTVYAQYDGSSNGLLE